MEKTVNTAEKYFSQKNVYGGHSSLDLASQEFSEFIIREVDMGFTSNPFFDEATGYRSNGCQRINYCSCDCNHCSWQVL